MSQFSYIENVYKLLLRILGLLSVKEKTADCLLRAVCEANESSSLAGDVGREAVEVGTFLLLSRLPLTSTTVSHLVMAARVGRLNYGTSLERGRERLQLRLLLFPGPGLCQRVYNGCHTYQ